MIKRLYNALLLSPKDFSPSDPRFKIIGAFNPGAVRYNDEIILLVRVAEAVKTQPADYLASPRVDYSTKKLTYSIDHVKIINDEDYRKPTTHRGLQRLAYTNHFEIVRLDASGHIVESITQHPDLFPRTDYEDFGIEDPRITLLDDLFYITYVAVSQKYGICTALMSTPDFTRFDRHGIIFPEENKDVTLLPKKMNGEYIAFHRPTPNIEINKPAIYCAKSKDLTHWGEYSFFLGVDPNSTWAIDKVGMCAPPIKTQHGWLHFYHGVSETGGNSLGLYSVGAALSSFDEPDQCLGYTREPILGPETDFEKGGYVPNVVFPTGALLAEDENVLLFYGAADTNVGVVTLSLAEIIKQIR